jgi:hypothetical protein
VVSCGCGYGIGETNEIDYFWYDYSHFFKWEMVGTVVFVGFFPIVYGGRIMDFLTTLVVITLLGVILVGIGLALQGWFILDLNKRISYVNGHLLASLTNLQQKLGVEEDE